MTLRMVELGFDDARGEAFAEAGDGAVEDGDELAVPAEIVLIILDIAERRGAAARGEDRIEGVDAGEMVDRPHPGEREQILLQIAQIVLALIFEDVIGDAVGRLTSAARSMPRSAARSSSAAAPLGREIGVRAEIAEPVGIAIIAAEHALHRIAAQARLVAVAEELCGGACPLRCARLGRARRGRGGAGRGLRQSGGRGRQQQSGGEQGAVGHDHGLRSDWLGQPARRLAIQSSILRSSTGSGSEPDISTWAWNSRRSKRDPSAASARGAKLEDLHLADLVGERLAGNGDVALDLGDDFGAAHAAIGEHIFDRLIAGPTLGVDAGIDDEAHRAQHLVVEAAEALIGVGLHAELVPERLGIERPALDEGGVAAEAHEIGQRGILVGEADLEVMARRAFVEIERLHAVGPPRGQVIGVVIEDAGARAVRRAVLIGAAGLVALAEGLDLADFEAGARQGREELADPLVDLAADRIITLAQAFAAGRLELAVGAQELEELGERAGEVRRGCGSGPSRRGCGRPRRGRCREPAAAVIGSVVLSWTRRA